MNFARFLMEQSLGRHLGEDEEVDHINDDCTDDRLENLQVLSKQAHREKTSAAARIGKIGTYHCLHCKISIELKVCIYEQRMRESDHKEGVYCSAECAGRGRTTRFLNNPLSFYSGTCPICNSDFTKPTSKIRPFLEKYEGKWSPTCSTKCGIRLGHVIRKTENRPYPKWDASRRKIYSGECPECQTLFSKPLKAVNATLKKNPDWKPTCSRKCAQGIKNRLRMKIQ